MNEEQIKFESIRNGVNHLRIDDFSGEELKRIRFIKEEQEKLSKLKSIVLISFLFSIIFLFFISLFKQGPIFHDILFFSLLMVVFPFLLFKIIKEYNYTDGKQSLILLVFLIFITICWSLFKKPEVPGWDMNSYVEVGISIIAGYFLNIIVSCSIYKNVFLHVAKKIKNEADYKLNPLIYLFKNKQAWYSITYSLANLFKEEIEKITKEVHKNDYDMSKGTFNSTDEDRTRIEVVLNSRIYKQYLIIFLNWINVIKTVIFAFIIIGLLGYKGIIINTLIAIFFFQFISRTIEIFFAFYKDIVRVDSKTFYNRSVEIIDGKKNTKYEAVYINNWKNSAIRKPMRISLAIHSIVEIVLSFSLIYYFAALISTIFPTGFTLGADYTLDFHSYLKTLLYSTSVSFFNFSFPNNNLLLSVLHIWQILISIVLISLSIASYIGKDDKLTDREAEYFFYIDKNFKHSKE